MRLQEFTDLDEKVPASLEIMDRSVREHDPSHVFGLFSGGHDSLCATHIASRHPSFSGAVHINTGIGIEETREFVRTTCEKQGWDLIEMYPDDKTYDELVLDKGFPHGPKSHNTMYYYLKQRQIRRLVREYKEDYWDRIGLCTGVRSQESDRRMRGDLSTEVQREGAQLWINPIVHWTGVEVTQYVDEVGLDRNPVVDHLHRSGECLCGAFANPNEIEEIELFFPEAAERIHRLEERCQEKNLKDCQWAVSEAPGETIEEGAAEDKPLCSSCIAGQLPKEESEV